MTNTIDELIDIILEQQETIILLIESIKRGDVIGEDKLVEMINRSYRISVKVRRIKKKRK